MIKKSTRMALIFNLLLLAWMSPLFAGTKGIYLTQWSLENTAFTQNLIKNAKAAGIDTFVIDIELPSKRYEQNIKMVKDSGLHYVARIVMFPDGGTAKQINDPAYWQKKFNLAKYAVDLGANQIQLDYIRYKASQKPSPDNAKHIFAIIQWYKNKLAPYKVPLQVDVFGIASYGESKWIGQNIKLFAQAVDVVCPMVYPSHYTPFAYHFKRPYETVVDSLENIQDQFEEEMPVKMIPYIELSNYHYPMSHEKTLAYIKAQLAAVEDADADGWYAWSPHNRYDNLFKVLTAGKQSGEHQHDAVQADKKVASSNDAAKVDKPEGVRSKSESHH